MKRVLNFKVFLVLFMMVLFVQISTITYANSIDYAVVAGVTPPIIGEAPITDGIYVDEDYSAGLTIADVAWYNGDTLYSGDSVIEKGQTPEIRIYYELEDGYTIDEYAMVLVYFGDEALAMGTLEDGYLSAQFEILGADSPYDMFMAVDMNPKIEYAVGQDYSSQGIEFYVSTFGEPDSDKLSNNDCDDVFLLSVEGFDSFEEGEQEINPVYYYKGLIDDTLTINITVGDAGQHSGLDEYETYDGKPITGVAVNKVPSSWDKVKNGDYSGFEFEIQFADGTTTVIEGDDEEELDIRYNPESITVIFKNYYPLNISVNRNDYRFYDTKNDSDIYTITTDYELVNQDIFDLKDNYPETYDLRDEITVRVENQGGFGLCWDFAVTKALETTYAKKYGEELDLSEMYIDYMTHKNIRGRRYTIHSGGYPSDYLNEALRDGISNEESLPYDEEKNYSKEEVMSSIKEVIPTSAFTINGRNINLYKNQEIITKMIKEQLMNNGGVSVCVFFDQNYFNEDDSTFFLPRVARQSSPTAHEVTIIGWNDNFDKDYFARTVETNKGWMDLEPENDGAWIVLNSWGDEYGDNGVFYLSYESFIKDIFGFLDVIPYEERNEYTYVENEFADMKHEDIDEDETRYIYQEFEVSGDNESITSITIANAPKGRVYYIDGYEDKDEIDYSKKKLIGDFTISTEYGSYYYSDFMGYTDMLKANFVFDEPIKINGDKFLIIVEIEGEYIGRIFYSKSNDIKTYITTDEMSSDWTKAPGDFYVDVYTVSEEEAEYPMAPENEIPLIIIRIDESEEAINAANGNESGHQYGTIEEMNSSDDHSLRCVGTAQIILPEGYESEYGSNDIPTGEQALSYIRGRGNLTWAMEKKPYKIKFKEKQSFLGMGANKEWGLLANALDDTLLHNAVAMWIGDQMEMPYTIKMVPVDVIIEGTNTERTYLGNYYLTELVDIGKSRVNIGELDSGDTEDITGGYLISLFYEPQDSDEPENTVFTTDYSEIKFINENPYFESGDLTDAQVAQRQYIRDFVNQIDDLIMNNEVIDGELHDQIDSLLDLKSTADYWLIQEFIVNFDAYKTSSNYLFKTKEGEQGGKLYWGPLWDFDLIHYLAGSRSTEGFNRSLPFAWLDKLRTSDAKFVQLLKDEWNNKLDGIIEELTKEGGQLDQYKARQQASWEANNELWNTDEELDYDEVIEEFRALLVDRRNWFNEHIDDIGTVYFTVTFEVDGEVVKEMQVRGNSSIYEIDIKAEKEGYVFNDWVNSETGESILNDLILGNYTYVPDFISADEIGNDATMYFSSYEVWANLEAGEYDDLSKAFYPSEYAETLSASVKWTSSNENVATVNVNGVVKLLAVGETTITGSLYNGVSKSYLLHVYSDGQEFNEKPTDVTLEKDEFTIEVGKTDQILYHLVPDPVDPDLYVSIDYELDSGDIIELESSCLSFIGLKEGKVTATITFENYQTEEKFEKEVVINVKAKSNENNNTKPNGKGSSRSSGSSSSSKKNTNKTIWSKVDDWALSEMNEALKEDLIPEAFEGLDFTKPISREEFAAVAVKLYEAISGKKAEILYSNPFEDTDNRYVLLAYSLGITKGVSDKKFGNGPITREQMITMLYRALEAAGLDMEVDLESVEKFADDGLMHDWSRRAIYFLSSSGVVKGVGNNQFGTKSNAKIEEAIAIALRCKAAFKIK